MTRCPRCHVELERIVKGTDEAWLCRQCDGVLLRKLDPYLEMTEEELLDSPVSESLFADHPEVDVDPPVGCPLCGQAMRRFVYSNDSGITVDSCPAGHGIDTLRRRMRALYGDRAALTISNGAGARVELRIPAA